MNIGRWAIVIIGCLLFFGIGYKSGEFVEAGGIAPGSVGDPLAAKSYVDKAVTEKLTQLQSQSQNLESKVTELQQTVVKLQEGLKNAEVVANGETFPTDDQLPPKNTGDKTTITSQKPTGQIATVTAPSANVRSGAGKDFPIVTGLLKGKSVPVLAVQNDWVNVELGNVKGWVSKDLVEIK